MSPEMLQLAINFLQRTPIQGNEAEQMAALKSALIVELQASQAPPVADNEPVAVEH